MKDYTEYAESNIKELSKPTLQNEIVRMFKIVSSIEDKLSTGEAQYGHDTPVALLTNKIQYAINDLTALNDRLSTIDNILSTL